MSSPVQRTRLVVVEGCNGTGKSTVARHLSARLGATLFHYPPEFVRFREEIRLDENVAPLPRLAYYLAGTLHLSDIVRTALTQSHVVCDRYLPSPISLLLSEQVLDESEIVRRTQPFEHDLCVPDVILLLTAKHAVARARICSRSQESGMMTPVARRTVESEEFFLTRETAIRKLAMRLGPVVELDTTNLAVEQMCDSAWNAIRASILESA